ncbi:RNase P subunit p30-domain-containing protein [Entophlyctis helioformis]|nr:RNase P subunit p30-domain-containing protein [Entophlyctis helioformis]
MIARPAVANSFTAACVSQSSNSQIIASYDLVSVQPMTEKLFQAACQQLDVDLITLDMGTRLPFYFKGPTINAAIQRGVAFEITYSQGIRDATARRHLFSNAAALVRVTKGKHIVLSSAAAHAIELRGPFDVMNLATIFGMNMAQAKAAMTDTVRSVLLHAATRKDSYRGVLSMEQMDTKKRPADDAGGVSGAEDEQQGQAWKAARLEDQDFVAFDFGDEDDDEGHDDGDDDDGGMDA